MQYHQIVIFTHRPWVSKRYIQPRSPRQGPGYHHARRMCIESSMAVARLLYIYEKHYTFRRMNNQVVAIIFSAALMLLYVTISPGKNGSDGTSNAEMVAYLNLCFRALDELGQSFENAKRTRDFLVTLQRRWQAHMRRTGSARKRQPGSRQPSQPPPGQQGCSEPDASRKRSRLSVSKNPSTNNNNTFPIPPTGKTATAPSATSAPQAPAPQTIPLSSDAQHFNACPSGEIDWIRNPELQLLAGGLADSHPVSQMGANEASYAEAEALPSLADIEPWWDSPNGTTTFGGSSL